jgi:hypothetical protein
MIANQFDASAILNLLSAIAALSAIILAIASELRAQRRFKQSNEIQERIAAANIKPLLSINQVVAVDERKVTLYNDGLGPAVIRKLTFTKEGRTGDSIPSILEIAKGFGWDSYREFNEPGYLQARAHIDLLVLSAKGLNGQGFNPTWVEEIFKKVNSEIIGIKISIELEDVLGNKQPNFETTLD